MIINIDSVVTKQTKEQYTVVSGKYLSEIIVSWSQLSQIYIESMLFFVVLICPVVLEYPFQKEESSCALLYYLFLTCLQQEYYLCTELGWNEVLMHVMNGSNDCVLGFHKLCVSFFSPTLP